MPEKMKTYKADEPVAAIWRQSIWENNFRCTDCGKLLWNRRKNEFTDNVQFYKAQSDDTRAYGNCVCGYPVVIVEENHDGETYSENWEEQLNKKHETEASQLRGEIHRKNRELGELQATVNYLKEIDKVRQKSLAELIEKENKLHCELYKTNNKLERCQKEAAALREELDRLRGEL